MVVAGFAAYTDINRAHEVANEVRRVAKQLKECQGMAQVYNNRERLFGLPLTNVCYITFLAYDSNPEFTEKYTHNLYLFIFCGSVWQVAKA